MNQTILASKKEVVANLVDKFNTSKSVVVVEYRGLTVSEISELRKQLREVDASLSVYKNTLVQKANDSL